MRANGLQGGVAWSAWRRVCVVFLCIGLTACATMPAAPPATLAAQAARERELQALTDWSLQGRVAVSNGEDGGSGGVSWRQSARSTDFELRAPVTGKSWRLQVDDDGARLDGLEGGPREARDAARLVRDAVGWELPLRQLTYWVRGLRAPGRARMHYDAAGWPSELDQDGWVIEYRDWVEVGSQRLPRKLFARHGQHSLRLVISRWQLGG